MIKIPNTSPASKFKQNKAAFKNDLNIF